LKHESAIHCDELVSLPKSAFPRFLPVPPRLQASEALSRNHGLPEARRRELEPWSGIKEYETYRRFQHWVREVFPGSRPLTVDFHLWRNEMAESRIRDAAELVASNQG